jgi:uncharacterized membrane protein
MLKLSQTISIVLFVMLFPFLSAYLVELGFASLELLGFAALTVWRGLKTPNPWLRFGSLVLAALLLAAAFFANAYFIWLVPSFAYLWLTALFGHTLWSPPSLCERLVRLLYPDFLPGVAEYLREVTWAWTLFFAVNIVICAALPAVAGQTAWAVYTGGVVYLLMVLLAIGEWFYRHRRFPDMPIPPAKETLKYLVQHGHEAFKDVWS